jgi:hypothetical protein
LKVREAMMKQGAAVRSAAPFFVYGAAAADFAVKAPE